jgi:energy-converting hydrogenase Eha subunit H
MELTERERRSLQRLIRGQRQWRWFRFVGLSIALGVMVMGVWLELTLFRELVSTTRNMSFKETMTGAEVFFASQFGGLLAVAGLLPGFGGMLVGLVIARWRGNPVHQLLIRVVQDAVDPHRLQGGDPS